MGLGAKIFTIAGPVIVYGLLASALYGVILCIIHCEAPFHESTDLHNIQKGRGRCSLPYISLSLLYKRRNKTWTFYFLVVLVKS